MPGAGRGAPGGMVSTAFASYVITPCVDVGESPISEMRNGKKAPGMPSNKATPPWSIFTFA